MEKKAGVPAYAKTNAQIAEMALVKLGFLKRW
jgi:hypothetical protein